MGKPVVIKPTRWRSLVIVSAIFIFLSTLALVVAPPVIRKNFRKFFIAPSEIILTTTQQENLKSTKLPVYSISIPRASMTKLESDPPKSLREYNPASFTYQGNTHRVKVKVRGDREHHWAFDRKSWRVRFRKTDIFQGTRRLNLIVPEERPNIVEHLARWTCRQMGILAPKCELVHLRLNGQYVGVYYSMGQTDEFFLFDQKRTFGEIYDNDFAPILATEDGLDAKYAFSVPQYWSKMTAYTEASLKDMTPLEQLCSIAMAKSETNNQHQLLSTVLNVEQYLRFCAFLTITGSAHYTTFHNVRFYLNPTNGLFEPIGWDTQGYGLLIEGHEATLPIDALLNKLHEKVLKDPVLLNRRNEILWQALNGVASEQAQLDKVEQTIDMIRPDVLCDKGKAVPGAPFFVWTNSEWEQTVKQLRNWISARHKFIREYMDSTRVLVKPEGGGLTILVSGANAVDLKSVKISSVVDTDVYFDANYNGKIDAGDRPMGSISSSSNGEGVVQAGLRFFPARRHKDTKWATLIDTIGYELSCDVSARYRLLFDKPTNVKVLSISATDSVTGRKMELTPVAKMPRVDAAWVALLVDVVPPPKTIIKWSKKHVVSDVFRLSAEEELVIEAGTKIELLPGASMLLRGRVLAEGTAENPIRFVRQNKNKPWGTVAIEGEESKGSIFRHCIFKGGKQARIGLARFLGAVSAYNTEIVFDHCDWIECEGEDALNTKHTEFLLKNCRFLRNAGDGFDCDFSTGTVSNCLFYFNYDDGMDCGTASPRIVDSLFIGQLDKGLSVGEQSSPNIENSLFWGNKGFGAAVKDLSQPVFTGCAFVRNGKGVSHYRKKEIFGGSDGKFVACLFANNKINIDADDLSSFSATYCQSETLIPGKGNSTHSDANFESPATLDELADTPNIHGIPLPTDISQQILKQLKIEDAEAYVGINRNLSFTIPTEVPASIFEKAAIKDR